MKSYRKELSLNIASRRGFVNITPQVEQALAASGIREGLCLVSAYHLPSFHVHQCFQSKWHPVEISLDLELEQGKGILDTTKSKLLSTRSGFFVPMTFRQESNLVTWLLGIAAN